MARIEIQESDHFLVLSKHETVKVLSLLAAQLGDTYVPHNQAGACPTLVVVDKEGNVKNRLTLVVETSKAQTAGTGEG